jgi:hypothetical protein
MLTLQRAPVSATPAYLWLATPANARSDQLDAGRDWVRLNLAATGLGLGLHPQSAALQEYPEMDGLLREVHRALEVERGRVQMLGRIGYSASEPPPSPRWPVETRIRPARSQTGYQAPRRLAKGRRYSPCSPRSRSSSTSRATAWSEHSRTG